MNEPKSSAPPPEASRSDMMAAVFANMVMQQTNMALMFLGQGPHPDSGQHVRDLDAARMFIDQLEMLEVKTKGNLDKREEGLLKQSLTALRMAFVEAVHQQAPPAAEKKPAPAPAPGNAPAGGGIEPGPEPAGSSGEAESRKKFSKKY